MTLWRHCTAFPLQMTWKSNMLHRWLYRSAHTEHQHINELRFSWNWYDIKWLKTYNNQVLFSKHCPVFLLCSNTDCHCWHQKTVLNRLYSVHHTSCAYWAITLHTPVIPLLFKYILRFSSNIITLILQIPLQNEVIWTKWHSGDLKIPNLWFWLLTGSCASY